LEFIVCAHIMTESELLFMMTAKICHDLSTPLGAMGMGLESLKDNPTDAIEFTYDSYNALEFKLSFYRTLMTPGFRGPELSDFVNLLNQYAKTKNITIHWQNLNNTFFFQDGVSRLLMGFTYIMIEPLIRGGDCYVNALNDENFIISSKGPICPIREEYQKILNMDNIEQQIINARNIMPAFLITLANSFGYGTNFQKENETIQLSLSKR
jgi:histidine phosphotransferase ChpT